MAQKMNSSDEDLKFTCGTGYKASTSSALEGGEFLCVSAVPLVSCCSGLPAAGFVPCSAFSERGEAVCRTGVQITGFILQLNQLFLPLKANKTFQLLHNLRRVLSAGASLPRKQTLEFCNVFIFFFF